MWKILQHKIQMIVICTGKQYSIKQFINMVLKIKYENILEGKGINEKAYDYSGKCIIECNKKYFRPSSESLLGIILKQKNT